MIDLNKAAKECYDIAVKRCDAGHNVPSPDDTFGLLKGCAGEVLEVQDAFYNYSYWTGGGNLGKPLKDHLCKELGLELADVFVYVLLIAQHCGIDMEKMLTLAIEKNRKRGC